MNSGYVDDNIVDFCKWFDKLDYNTKIFIAGNHDKMFEQLPQTSLEIVNSYKWINYLQDDYIIVDGVKIYGSPWQPFFHNWAFNLPRNETELKSKWDKIPTDTDILVTHGPAWGKVDTVKNRNEHLGCELLAERIKEIKPKIHVCGHIHSGNGYMFDGHTHSFNASVLNEKYNFEYKPFIFEWDKETNEIEFLQTP